MIDTASVISIISKKIYENFKSNGNVCKLRKQRNKAIFTTYNGDEIPIEGYVVVPVKMNNEEIQHQFFVVDQQHTGALLGDDFLRRFGVSISFVKTKSRSSRCPVHDTAGHVKYIATRPIKEKTASIKLNNKTTKNERISSKKSDLWQDDTNAIKI